MVDQILIWMVYAGAAIASVGLIAIIGRTYGL